MRKAFQGTWSLLGIVGTIVTFVVLAITDSAERWIASNPTWVAVIVVALAYLALAAPLAKFDWWRDQRSKTIPPHEARKILFAEADRREEWQVKIDSLQTQEADMPEVDLNSIVAVHQQQGQERAQFVMTQQLRGFDVGQRVLRQELRTARLNHNQTRYITEKLAHTLELHGHARCTLNESITSARLREIARQVPD